MEIRRKRKKATLAGLFTKYTVIFCANSILIVCVLFCAISMLPMSGIFLTADHTEIQLSERQQEISSADVVTADMIPAQCGYGIYDQDGWYCYGNFTDEEKEPAWKHYQADDIQAGGAGYYRFIERESGEICIVKYELRMKFADERFNEVLPDPERVIIVAAFFLFVLLMFLNAVCVSRKFAEILKRRLKKLETVTKKIADSELDFEIEAADIREIDAVMDSFEKMKQELKRSLERQWKLEAQKSEQMAALAHDIKTPLTIIRGHAELLSEEKRTEEEQESLSYILLNVQQIESYLASMRQVLGGSSLPEKQKQFSAEELEELLYDIARQTTAAKGSFVTFSGRKTDVAVKCDRGLLVRSFENILSNALDYGDCKKGIRVAVMGSGKEEKEFLKISVFNFGRGFSKRDLLCADQEFYSGDESRHGGAHQGLGLAIVRKFAQAQGGYIEYRNEDGGAVVELYLKVE